MSPVQIPSTGARSQFHEEVNMFAGSAPGLKSRERRRHQRFPINVSSRYLLDEARGYATTVNISSGGVLLDTKEILPVGRQVQLWIDWPALLDARCPLRLVIHGRIVRSTYRGTVVGITRYSFRLRPKSEAPFTV